MNRLILAAFLLFCTLPLHAQTPDCLPHPTQDCVLQMALRQAEANSEFPIRMATGFMVIALLQEAEGLDGAPETLNRMLATLSKLDPDPEAIRNSIAGGMFGIAFYSSLNSEAPQTVARVHGLLVDLNSGTPPDAFKAVTIKPPTHTAKDTALRQRIKEAPTEDVPLLANVPDSLDYRRFEVGTITGTADGYEDLRMAIDNFGRKHAFAAAEAYATEWPDADGRSLGAALVAVDLAQVGRFGDALAVIERAGLSHTAGGTDELSVLLAEVFARTGDPMRAKALLDGLKDPDRYTLRTAEFRFMAALVSENWEDALGVLYTAKPSHQDLLLRLGVEALLVSGGDSFEYFFGLLGPDLQPLALVAMGRFQVSIGDADGALATLERLQALGAELPLHNDIRMGLAPLLAAKGRYQEAVVMADALNFEITTAKVASLID